MYFKVFLEVLFDEGLCDPASYWEWLGDILAS